MEFLEAEYRASAAEELAPKKKRLEDGQSQRIFAEDRFRDLQKLNHTTLFEYEKKEAAAVCDISLRVLKDSLLAEVARKRELLSRFRELTAECAARVASGGSVEAESVFPSKKRGPLDLSLSPEELSDDLHRIASDVNSASRAFLKASGGEEASACEPMFQLNDTLSVFSRMTQKEVVGRLVDCDDAKLKLRLNGGHEVQFSLKDLASGMLIVSNHTHTPKADE